MRIIAGKAKGKIIYAPRGAQTRPLTDRVKESIFSILGEQVKGARVLDLYAGSGSFGVEALSRGAAEVVFVDSHPAAIRVIQRNVRETRFATQAEVMRSRVKEAIQQLSSQGREFDLIFLDPPFRISIFELKTVLGELVKQKVFVSGGMMVLRHFAKIKPGVDTLKKISTRRYGESAISFFIARPEVR